MKKKINSEGVDMGRGLIKDNYLAAAVTSKLYQSKVIAAKKGKGSFKRHNKHKGEDSYLIAA